MGKVIAVDGPAGAGKSTLCRKLAEKMGYRYLDTGAMYRAITWLALKEKLDLNDVESLTKLAREAEIQILPSGSEGVCPILVNGEDVTLKIRQPVIDRNVSRVARVRGVREEMVRIQRHLAEDGKIVIDGRDIGTRVVPDADLKLFITASLEERAKRRYQDLSQDDEKLKMEKVKSDIKKRDKIDSEREVSPLIQAEDAILIDTTNYSIEEVIEKVLKIIKGEKDG